MADDDAARASIRASVRIGRLDSASAEVGGSLHLLLESPPRSSNPNKASLRATSPPNTRYRRTTHRKQLCICENLSPRGQSIAPEFSRPERKDCVQNRTKQILITNDTNFLALSAYVHLPSAFDYYTKILLQSERYATLLEIGSWSDLDVLGLLQDHAQEVKKGSYSGDVGAIGDINSKLPWESEVADFGRPSAIDEDVASGEISVHEPHVRQVFAALCHIQQQAQECVEGKFSCLRRRKHFAELHRILRIRKKHRKIFKSFRKK